MALVHPISDPLFLRDLRAATQDVAAGVVPSRSREATAHWNTWAAFCASLSVDPTLQGIQDPIPLLQVFAHRFRNGVINTSHRRVRSKTVDHALRNIGQAFATVGAPDPRFTSTGKLDFRLQRMLAAYRKTDPPPNRVKPLPLPILQHVMATAIRSQSPCDLAIADMLCLAFFFLLRPGEYTGTVSDTQPFLLRDVSFFIGTRRLDTLSAPIEHLQAATFVTLEFTTQKNAVRGEVIGLSRSGDPYTHIFAPSPPPVAVQCIFANVKRPRLNLLLPTGPPTHLGFVGLLRPT